MHAALVPVQPTTPAPFRACDLCDHGTTVDGVRHCQYSSIATSARSQFSVPVHVARSPSGACGLEARHMSAEFLRVA